MGKDAISYMCFSKNKKTTNPEKYIKELLPRIMEDFKAYGQSEGLSEILVSIANNKSDEVDSRILLNVVYELCNRVYKVGPTDAARDLLTYLLKCAKWGPYDVSSKEPDVQGLTSRRAAPVEMGVNRIQQQARNNAQSLESNARVQADRDFEAQKEALVPRAVRDLVEAYRKEDAEEYRKSDEDRKKLIQDLEQDHAELCERVKGFQADINDILSSAQNNLCDYLTKWREAFYIKEVRGLADCYVNLHRILSQLDRQFYEAAAACTPPEKADDGSMPSSWTSGADVAGSTYPSAEQDQLGYQPAPAAARPEEAAAQQFVEQLGRNRKNLNRFAKQLRTAMLGVGLDVYIPVEGDRFDSALHTLGEGDEDNYALEGREIARCRVPGVRMLQLGGSAKGFESLTRAEVELK